MHGSSGWACTCCGIRFESYLQGMDDHFHWIERDLEELEGEQTALIAWFEERLRRETLLDEIDALKAARAAASLLTRGEIDQRSAHGLLNRRDRTPPFAHGPTTIR